ncbi:LysR substrate-binding domain-containing protein [Hypericibacter sp.]|uniref:LysR substrate-binding domain-containing protein n=1 Tax=Hypericibacter sp. TaxID=2705401 RepID=UPI003D6DA042
MARRSRNLPPLTSLVAFEAAARQRSLTRAAKELNVTPGAISKQIKALETEAGVALLLRGHRSVEMTPQGEILHAALTRGFGEIVAAFQRIKSSSGGHRSVTLGSTTAFAQMWLMPRLGHFWRMHQDITVNHVISDSSQDLGMARIDLRVRYGAGDWHNETAIRLFGDQIYPVCSPEFAGRHPAKGLADVTSLPLLELETGDPSWTGWADWLKGAGGKARSLTLRTFSSYVVALQAAQDGQGVALGWHSLVAPLVESGKLVVLGSARMAAAQAFYVTWDEHKSLSPEARVLRDWLISFARPDPEPARLG